MAAINMKLIILAVVLSAIVSLAAGETVSGDAPAQTAEKLAIAPPQPAAAPWDNGTNPKKLMPEDKIAQATTHTQKAMKGPEITILQVPALPLSQKETGAETTPQTTIVTQESTEPDIQSTSSTMGSQETGPASMNNLLYIAAVLVLILAVWVLLKGRTKKVPGAKKE